MVSLILESTLATAISWDGDRLTESKRLEPDPNLLLCVWRRFIQIKVQFCMGFQLILCKQRHSCQTVRHHDFLHPPLFLVGFVGGRKAQGLCF